MIEVRDAHKELGQFSLRGANLRVETGEYFVVLGPTGAGKTVLLECIAGLHRLDRGEVWLDGRNVTHLEPERRNIGYVPQDYVLFPHISLRANIEFSLVLRGAPRVAIDARVQELAAMLSISHLLERRPRTLSGGEQQRGALARALAPSPTVLLLDEPLSALDEGTRAELSRELERISDQTHTTVIHVCHSFDEALDLADRLAIMHQGRILQVGTPAEVFSTPTSEFLARFVGGQNLFAVAAADPVASQVTLGGGAVLGVGTLPVSERLLATIRPEEIHVVTAAAAAAGDFAGCGDRPNVLSCVLARVDDRGRLVRLHLQGSIPLLAMMTRQAFRAAAVAEGDQVVAVFDRAAVHLLAP